MHKDLSQPELRSILKGIIKGSEGHFRTAMSVKMGLGHEEAKEIVQETFLSIWQQRHKLSLTGSLPGLVFTISKRLAIRVIQDRLRFTSIEVNQPVAIGNTTEEYVIFRDLQSFAQQEIDQMPAKRKQIYMLSKQLGLTNEEIATKLKVSKRTVENQLYRATRQLKTHLGENLLPLYLLCSIFF